MGNKRLTPPYGNMYHSIKAIYYEPYCCVNVNNMLTDWFLSESSVRQGDTLSPTLFGVFINDIVSEINGLNQGIVINGKCISILLYTDDIAIMSETPLGLQHMLTQIHKWSTQWRIRFNIKKSQVVHYRRSSVPLTESVFYLGETQLDIVSQYKYLGVILNEFLDYSVTAKFLADSGNRALGALINKYKHLNGLGYYSYTKLFQSGVCPILDYGSGIRGFGDYSSIYSIQNKAMRIFLGVHKCAPLPALTGDMGCSSSSTRRKVNICRFYNILHNMENNRITKFIFEWDKNLDTSKTWSSEIRSILAEINLSNDFDNNTNVNINMAQTNELFCKNWKLKIVNMPKLRTYKTFKTRVEPEPYVISFMSRRQRSILAQLRFGILPIEIEIGRWSGKDLGERM